MKDKKCIIVNNNCLAPLLVQSIYFEAIPLPFRLQNNLTMVIKFDEYIEFCDKAPYDLFGTPLADIQSSIVKYKANNKGNIEELFSIFTKDVCFAILKELFYSQLIGKESTNIIHSSEIEGVAVTDKEIDELYPIVQPKVENMMLAHMKSRGYNLEPTSYLRSLGQYKYATILYFYSLSEVIWSYSYI